MKTTHILSRREVKTMKVKRLNLEIGKMMLFVRFWDKGEHYFLSTNCSYRDVAYITNDNRIRFIDSESDNANIEVVKEDFEKYSKRFFDGHLEKYIIEAMRYCLNNLQLLNSVHLDFTNNGVNTVPTRHYFPNNNEWFLEEGRARYEIKLRNLQITICGIAKSSYGFWTPGGETLFEEFDEFVDIPENKFVPVIQRARQLELNFEET